VMKNKHLGHDKVKWRDFVNTVMNLRITEKTGDLITSCATFTILRTPLHGVSYVPDAQDHHAHFAPGKCCEQHTCFLQVKLLIVLITERFLKPQRPLST
jgi:hypothetical protein